MYIENNEQKEGEREKDRKKETKSSGVC